MTTEELLALAERCEKEAAGSRELDAEIAKQLYAKPAPQGYSAGFVTNRFGYTHPAPEYTKSLDLARSIMPEGSLWSVCDMEDGPYAQVIRPVPGHGFVGGLTTGKGQTAVTSLCAAALRALAATE